MDDKIRIVKCPARGPAVISFIDNTLEAMQKVVGGYIETVSYGHFVVVCNEEGVLKGLPVNSSMPQFVGDIFITRADGENFTDLSVTDADIIRRLCSFHSEATE